MKEALINLVSTLIYLVPFCMGVLMFAGVSTVERIQVPAQAQFEGDRAWSR